MKFNSGGWGELMADSTALKTPLQPRSRMRIPGWDAKGEQRGPGSQCVWAERTRVTPCGHRRTRVTPCGQNEPHSETSGCGVPACFLGQVNGENMRLQPHRVHWEEASLKNGVKDGDFVCGMPHLRNFWLTRAGMSIWHAVHSRQGAPARERDLIIVCK